MAERTIFSAVKNVPPSQVRAVIDQACSALPGPMPKGSKWSDWTYQIKPRPVVGLTCSDALVLADDAWTLAQEISRLVSGAHLELRIQEGDHWDFSLYQHGTLVADFSTRVAYFNYRNDPYPMRPWKQGDASAFAKVWGVPLDQIAPYLIDWDALAGPQFVRSEDQAPAGHYQQIYDFMRVIGIESPYLHPNRMEFSVPTWQSVFMRQPAWRRAVRRLSVLIKGTTPDVPRRSKAEREAWGHLAANVQLVKVELEGEDPEESST